MLEYCIYTCRFFVHESATCSESVLLNATNHTYEVHNYLVFYTSVQYSSMKRAARFKVSEIDTQTNILEFLQSTDRTSYLKFSLLPKVRTSL